MDVFNPWLSGTASLGVVPVLVGPLNALFAAAPGIALALFGLAVTLFKPKTIKKLLQLLWSQKIVMVPLIVVLVGLFYGWSMLFPRRVGAVSVAVGGDKATWLAFRGGPERRGFVGDDLVHGGRIEDPAHGNINWSFKDDNVKTFFCSPAVVGNRIYVTGVYYTKSGVFGSDTGGIYSLDAETGQLVWAYHGDGYRSTFSSPAVWGKYLVVGEGLHETKDSRIFCIDIEASEKAHKGVKLWDYRTTSHMESSPCIDVVNKNVMIGGADDGVYCFKLDPDANKKPVMVWQLPGKDYPDCETSPVIADGKLYFGLGRDVHAMCCADPKTGKPIWRIPAPYPTASPAVAGGKVYFGMGIGDFVNSANDLRANRQKELELEHKSQADIDAALKLLPDAGELWCVDSATQKIDWKFDIGETILGAPAVDGDRVYAGAHNGMFYCISTAGPEKSVRKFNAHGPIVSSPAVGDKCVYVSTMNGTLFALDKNTLAVLWSVGLNADCFSSPTVGNGHVYLGTGGVGGGAGLLSIGMPGREKAEAVWAGAMGGAGRSGTVDGSQIAPQGSWAWSSEAAQEEGGTKEPNAVYSPSAVIGNAFYVGAKRDGVNGVAAFASEDDLAGKPAQLWIAKSALPVTISPAATETRVIFVDGKKGDKNRMLHCVDRQNGTEIWTHPIAEDGSGDFAIADSQIYLAGTGKGIVCLDLQGKELWTADVGSCIGMPAVMGDVVAAAVENGVVVLDRMSGQLLWRQATEAPRTGAVVVKDLVWIGTSAGARGYSMVGGGEKSLDCGPVVGTIAGDGESLAVTTEKGDLVVFSGETGEKVATASGANPAVPPMLVSDSVLYYGKDSIQRLDLVSKQSTTWAKIQPSWFGGISTPMVMVNSHLFFGTEKRGFVCMKPKKG